MPRRTARRVEAGREVLEAGDRGGDVERQEERCHGVDVRIADRRDRFDPGADRRGRRDEEDDAVRPFGDPRPAARVEPADAAERDDRSHCKASTAAVGAARAVASVAAGSVSAAARPPVATTHQRAPRRLCCLSPTDTDAALASTRTSAKATSRDGGMQDGMLYLSRAAGPPGMAPCEGLSPSCSGGSAVTNWQNWMRGGGRSHCAARPRATASPRTLLDNDARAL